MVYLPEFGQFLWQMYVNIPYIECLGMLVQSAGCIFRIMFNVCFHALNVLHVGTICFDHVLGFVFVSYFSCFFVLFFCVDFHLLNLTAFLPCCDETFLACGNHPKNTRSWQTKGTWPNVLKRSPF